MFSFPNPGEFYGPINMLNSYKNIQCDVNGETVVVSVNNYRNYNNSADKGGCQDAVIVKDRLLHVAPDALSRAGGAVAYVDTFVGKGSPAAIEAVLETFAIYSDAFIKAYSGSTTNPEGKCAAILADDSISWQETLQQICDLCIGLDCNGFVGNWLKIVQPDFHLNQNSRANDVRAKAIAYRTELDQIEYWDIMCYVNNEHIAAINDNGMAPNTFQVCQSAGGGPRVNDYAFIKTGEKTFKLAAPTANDIGHEFYVISLW